MKKVCKLLSAMLVICLLASLLLTGCGDKKEDTAAATTQTNSEPGTVEAKKDPVEIVFICWGDAAAKKSNEDAAKIFESKHDWIKVKPMILPSQDYDTKITTMVAAKEQIDIAELESATIAYPLAEQGKLYNLKKLLDSDKEVTIDSYIPEAYYKTDKDTIIGIGYGIEMFNLYYNPEMFAKAGAETPPANPEQAWEWDKFVEVAKKLTLDGSGKNAADPGFNAKDIKQYGITFPKWWGLWGNFVYANGGDFVTDDGKFGLSQPEAAEGIQKLADLINVHHVSPNATSEKGMPGMDIALQTKKVAMVIEGQWCHNSLGNSKVNFEVGSLPKMKYVKTQAVTGMFSVFADSKSPEAAFEYLKFVNDPAQNLEQYTNGTLMPVVKDWLTKPELLDQWIKGNPAHSSKYQEAVIGMLLNNGVPTPTGTVKNFNKIMDVVNPALDKVWIGEKTAADALKECEPKVADLVQGKRER